MESLQELYMFIRKKKKKESKKIRKLHLMAILLSKGKKFYPYFYSWFKKFLWNTKQVFFIISRSHSHSYSLSYSLTFFIYMYSWYKATIMFYLFFISFKAQQEAFELLIAIKHYYMHKWWIAIIFSFASGKWKVPMGDLMTFVIVAITKI